MRTHERASQIYHHLVSTGEGAAGMVCRLLPSLLFSARGCCFFLFLGFTDLSHRPACRPRPPLIGRTECWNLISVYFGPISPWPEYPCIPTQPPVLPRLPRDSVPYAGLPGRRPWDDIA